MRFRFGLAEFILAVIALGAVAYGFRYAVTQGLQIVIASQPPAVKPSDTYPSFDWAGCDLGLSKSRAIVSKPCRFEPTPAPEPQAFPVQLMSEADSQKAALWFSSAGLLPLGGGVAAVLALLFLRGLASKAASRREYAALERLAALPPERDPFDRDRF
ncbi:MAG TPA: hypothetical protein VN823_13660 [Stellaceae bacterium]|nr:hypothetical protein [Stellaceae bacterium]